MEGLYYLCSENKGADQLRGYREADLRLFSHVQKAGFLTTRLIYDLVRGVETIFYLSYMLTASGNLF